MEGRCNDCGNHNVALHHDVEGICYDCYEKMFENTSPMPNPFDEEPDFELKYDTAQVKENPEIFFVTDKRLSIYGTNIMPKKMVFNPDCRVKDYDKLVLFLLENLPVYENAKGFDKVRYMFKEYKEDDK